MSELYSIISRTHGEIQFQLDDSLSSSELEAVKKDIAEALRRVVLDEIRKSMIGRQNDIAVDAIEEIFEPNPAFSSRHSRASKALRVCSSHNARLIT